MSTNRISNQNDHFGMKQTLSWMYFSVNIICYDLDMLLPILKIGFCFSVTIPPIITTHPEKEIFFKEGQSVEIPCVASGQPEPT